MARAAGRVQLLLPARVQSLDVPGMYSTARVPPRRRTDAAPTLDTGPEPGRTGQARAPHACPETTGLGLSQGPHGRATRPPASPNLVGTPRRRRSGFPNTLCGPSQAAASGSPRVVAHSASAGAITGHISVARAPVPRETHGTLERLRRRTRVSKRRASRVVLSAARQTPRAGSSTTGRSGRPPPSADRLDQGHPRRSAALPPACREAAGVRSDPEE